eukprot:GHVP01063107.1.p1 GENE.GHVP01063107.1~~GHVP01063107.1.p1  ORF type:complete len:877 (+),score=122.89 GHVP01063107.1:11-2641(+)
MKCNKQELDKLLASIAEDSPNQKDLDKTTTKILDLAPEKDIYRTLSNIVFLSKDTWKSLLVYLIGKKDQITKPFNMSILSFIFSNKDSPEIYRLVITSQLYSFIQPHFILNHLIMKKESTDVYLKSILVLLSELESCKHLIDNQDILSSLSLVAAYTDNRDVLEDAIRISTKIIRIVMSSSVGIDPLIKKVINRVLLVVDEENAEIKGICGSESMNCNDQDLKKLLHPYEKDISLLTPFIEYNKILQNKYNEKEQGDQKNNKLVLIYHIKKKIVSKTSLTKQLKEKIHLLLEWDGVYQFLEYNLTTSDQKMLINIYTVIFILLDKRNYNTLYWIIVNSIEISETHLLLSIKNTTHIKDRRLLLSILEKTTEYNIESDILQIVFSKSILFLSSYKIDNTQDRLIALSGALMRDAYINNMAMLNIFVFLISSTDICELSLYECYFKNLLKKEDPYLKTVAEYFIIKNHITIGGIEDLSSSLGEKIDISVISRLRLEWIDGIKKEHVIEWVIEGNRKNEKQKEADLRFLSVIIHKEVSRLSDDFFIMELPKDVILFNRIPGVKSDNIYTSLRNRILGQQMNISYSKGSIDDESFSNDVILNAIALLLREEPGNITLQSMFSDLNIRPSIKDTSHQMISELLKKPISIEEIMDSSIVYDLESPWDKFLDEVSTLKQLACVVRLLNLGAYEIDSAKITLLYYKISKQSKEKYLVYKNICLLMKKETIHKSLIENIEQLGVMGRSPRLLVVDLLTRIGVILSVLEDIDYKKVLDLLRNKTTKLFTTVQGLEKILSVIELLIAIRLKESIKEKELPCFILRSLIKIVESEKNLDISDLLFSSLLELKKIPRFDTRLLEKMYSCEKLDRVGENMRSPCLNNNED